jgi:hypothetical protein
MDLGQIYEEIDYKLNRLDMDIKDLFDITHNEIEDDLQCGSLFAINIRITKLYNDSMDILMIISEKILTEIKNLLIDQNISVCVLINTYFEIKKNINNFVRISILRIDSDVNSLYFNTLTVVSSGCNY